MARNPRFGRPGGGRRLTSLAAAVIIKGGGGIVIPTPTPIGVLGIGFAGSSTPEKYFNTFTGPSNARVAKTSDGTTYTAVGTTGQGAAVLGDTLATALNRNVQFIAGGSGGTTLTQWESSSSTLRAAFVNAINARGGVDAVVIGVGFNDARVDRSVVSVETHAAKLRSLYAKVRAETNLPNLPIFILATQKYTEGNATSAAQTVMVRSAELMVAEDANNRLYAHVYDLAQVDGIHMSNGEYTKHAARGAAQILAQINGTAQIRGPKLISATPVSPTQTDVKLQYVSGSDFTPTTGLSGFLLSTDNFASTLAITGAARQSTTVVRLTHASTGASVVTAGVQYMQTGAPDVSGALYANTAPLMPLDPTTASLTFQTIADTGVAPAPAPAPAPATTFSDTFDNADSANLTAHTSNTGQTWSAVIGSMVISGNEAYGTTSGGAGAAYLSNFVPASADYMVKAFFKCLTVVAGIGAWVLGRASTSGTTRTHYQAGYQKAGANGEGIYLGKTVDGTFNVIGYFAYVLEAGAAPEIGLVMSGTSISATLNGSVVIAPVTDESIKLAGTIGLRALGVSSATTGIHFDNLAA